MIFVAFGLLLMGIGVFLFLYLNGDLDPIFSRFLGIPTQASVRIAGGGFEVQAAEAPHHSDAESSPRDEPFSSEANQTEQILRLRR